MKKLKLSLLLVAMFLVSGIYAQLSNEPLLLHLDFEDAGNIAKNEQGLTSAVATPTAGHSTEAKIGKGAASFDGSQYIIMDQFSAINCQANSYTWAIWVKTSDKFGGSILNFSPWSGIAALPNGPVEPLNPGSDFGGNDPADYQVANLYFDGTAGAPTLDYFFSGAITADPLSIINDDKWHHIAVTVDLTTKQELLYIDGKVQSTIGSWGTCCMDPSKWVLKLGYSNSSFPLNSAEEIQLPYFNGLIDDFRMYGSVLTADEVTELVNNGTSSVKEYYAERDFSVYPNPASKFIKIKSKATKDLTIYNEFGQLVLTKRAVHDGNKISVTGLKKGLYFLKLGYTTQKLIIN